ncbi:hypothetical protein BJ138DRAFT_1159333 [Hygrophoropsis aurantiaca]|uniref:Uncharacterized protein n=1 Tax=Hygrophoropsis aurantiaca TaxID=72124 RepID=A0ACB8A3Y9_9AGAM|nr:hypothetical protein BJ138DRAFT_1159333 [Hygrophoropsis aurantiaca]
MLQDLPTEILCNAITHLPIRDILALRQVSKYLNQVTRVRSIWAHAYHTSSLVRPPGPFTWQTAQILESNLIQSARLSLNWPPNLDAMPIRSHTITLDSIQSQFSLLCGRWLRMDQNSTRIVCYDLDRTENLSAEEPYSILYESPDRSTKVKFFECESIPAGERSGANDQNEVAFLVIVEKNEAVSAPYTRTLYRVDLAEETFPRLTMVLQANLNSQSFHCQVSLGLRHVAVYDVPLGPDHPTVRAEVVLLDLETYQRYNIPESDSQTPEGYSMFIQQIVISSTHMLVIWVNNMSEWRQLPEGSPRNYIQAYITPPPQGSRPAASAGQSLYSAPITLQLSHEGAISCENDLDVCTLLRDSKINQVTDTIDMVLSEIQSRQASIRAIPVKLAPGLQGIGSITLGAHINKAHVKPTNRHKKIEVNPGFNSLTRGMAYIHKETTNRVAAFVLDDEDRENTQTIADRDMKFFRELELDAQTRIVGFDAHRGRLVTQNEYTLTVFDFV